MSVIQILTTDTEQEARAKQNSNSAYLQSDAQLKSSNLQTQINNIGNASPKGVYVTLSALQAAYPSGTTGIFVVTVDGKWYFWNGSAWTAGGTYQSTGIANGEITPVKTTFFNHYESKNLFNKNSPDIVSGYDLSTIDGTNQVNTNFEVSGYIPCDGLSNLTSSYSPTANENTTRELYPVTWCFYDANHNFISGNNVISGVTVPSTAKYFRITFWMGFQNIRFIQIESGTSMTSYADYFASYDDFKTEYIPENSIFKSQLETEFDIVLPTYGIYGTAGNPFNIYYDNILFRINREQAFLCFNYEDVTVPYERFSRMQESRGAGDQPYAIGVSANHASKYGAMLTHDLYKSVVIRLADKAAGSGVTKKCLFIGDSMTAAMVYLSQLLNLFDGDAMSIELLGSLSGTAVDSDGTSRTVKHEGRGGWRAWNYAFQTDGSGDGLGSSVTNPFYNPSTSQFDFSYYMTHQGYSGVDNVFINLGTNDRARLTHTSDADILLAYQTIINSIRSYNSNTRIFLWMCPMPSALEVSDFEKDFDLQTHRVLISNYDNQINNRIYLVDVGACLDRENDFQYVTAPVNRYGTETFKKSLDRIHPANNGYFTIADMIYSAIKFYPL